MWGWRIRIGDLFSADYTPIPPQYLWKKKITKEGEETNSTTFGVAYQSVLSNITWIDKGNSSPFIQKLQRAMNQVNISGKDLSIRFNLDMYETYSRKNTFTTGRITGISFFRLFIFYILYFPRGTNQSEALPRSGSVTRHQYGISALVSQTSFGGETSGSVAKCRLSVSGYDFSIPQALFSLLLEPKGLGITLYFSWVFCCVRCRQIHRS